LAGQSHVPAIESWTCHRLLGEMASTFARRSRDEAHAWVDWLAREKVLFVVEFDPQDAAAAARASFDGDNVG
jgi:hypothetical protein